MCPSLDVNDAYDPSFWDNIIVVRRTVTVDQNGRGVVTEKPISTRAVVTAAGPNELQRIPEEEYFNKAIDVYSPFRFQGTSTDELGNVVTHPDHILWHGSVFVVRTLDDYSGYGRGFIHVVAVSINAVDPPPPAQGGDNVTAPHPMPVKNTVH
jgi:hypothetical protein